MSGGRIRPPLFLGAYRNLTPPVLAWVEMTRTRSKERPRSGRLWLDVDDAADAFERQPGGGHEPPPPPRAQRRAAGDDVPRPRPSRRPSRRRRLAAAVALALGCLALGLAAIDQTSDLLAADDAEPQLPAGAAGGVVGQVSDVAADGVVAVRVERDGGAATGSGFVVDEDGTLVTNAHVVEGVETASVQFQDEGASFSAEVLGTDPSSDLAVLRVDPAEVGELHPLELADSDRVEVGDRVVAIGHPLGLETTTSRGSVTGLDREISAPNGFTIPGAIQTDARLLPGNSGGPLLDDQGHVVGVNSQVAVAPQGLDAQIGFAVPSNTVRDAMPDLEAGDAVEHAYLGVAMGDGATGVEIEEVTPGGPAEGAGLRRGDVVSAFNGQPVGAADDLSAAVAERDPGDSVALEVTRGGQTLSLDVVLGTQPDSAPAPTP
jgi:putative serine protease PepD